MVRRSILRWLLWSRRRLLIIIVGAALIPIMVTQLSTGIAWLAATRQVPATSQASSSEPPAPSSSPTAEATPVAAAPAGAPSFGPPRAVAKAFTQLWIDTNVDPQTWLRRLQPLCTPEYGLVVLPQVDPPNIPSARLSGSARLVRSDARSAEVEVALVGGSTITVGLVDVTGDGAWRVNTVQPSGP